jgi:predicted secreted protein
MPLSTVTAVAEPSKFNMRRVGILRTLVHTSVCALYFCVLASAIIIGDIGNGLAWNW